MSSKAKIKNIVNYDDEWTKNRMRKPYLEKIILNIGVGAGGEELERATNVLESISGKKPVKTLSKVNVKEFTWKDVDYKIVEVEKQN